MAVQRLGGSGIDGHLRSVLQSRSLTGKIQRADPVGEFRSKTVGRNVDPAEFLERGLVGIRPGRLAGGLAGRRLLERDAIAEANFLAA
jgi:hypothetical protein